MSEEQLKELASYSTILMQDIDCCECPIEEFCKTTEFRCCSETILNFLANADERLDIEKISTDRFGNELTKAIEKKVFEDG